MLKLKKMEKNYEKNNKLEMKNTKRNYLENNEENCKNKNKDKTKHLIRLNIKVYLNFDLIN